LQFNIEQLLDVFFSQSLTNSNKIKLEIYLELFADKYIDNKELLKEIQDLKNII
jgi:hypothetical protein